MTCHHRLWCAFAKVDP